MTVTSTARGCPKCRSNTDRVHCAVNGCGWWLCDACKIMFTRRGVTASYPRTI
jgi:hypothetical protein